MENVILKGKRKDVVLYLAKNPEASNADIKRDLDVDRYLETLLKDLYNIFDIPRISQRTTHEVRKQLVRKCKEWRYANGGG